MPTPEGFITTSAIWQQSPEEIEKQEEQEDLAAYDAAVADPDPGVPLEEIDWKEE